MVFGRGIRFHDVSFRRNWLASPVVVLARIRVCCGGFLTGIGVFAENPRACCSELLAEIRA